MKGKVHLVGAGPGDPDLLTLKALKLLRDADVVFYDELVSAEILGLIPAHVTLQSVGKRAGRKSTPQAEINDLMISHAELGLDVVRLKGGDPLIFGRAGEEMEALRQAGLDFEVVPGVTSAFGAAAAAHIPLTHRHVAPAVTLLAGHRAQDNDSDDWTPYAASGATLVLYMPGDDYAAISTKLRTSGLAGDVPCAVISRATTPEQQIYKTTVARLAETAPFPAPALMVIGAVAEFAETSLSAHPIEEVLMACCTHA